MDPITTVVAAAMAASATKFTSQNLKDTYRALMTAIRERYPNIEVSRLEETPESVDRQVAFSKDLVLAGADRDAALLHLAEALTEEIGIEAPQAAPSVGIDLDRLMAELRAYSAATLAQTATPAREPLDIGGTTSEGGDGVSPLAMTCYVVRSHSPDQNEVHEVSVRPAIDAAGLTVVGVSEEEPNGITVRGVARLIQSAQIVIADISERNANVMYEVGIAQGLGKRLVLLNSDPAHFPLDLLIERMLSYSATPLGLASLRAELTRVLDAFVREAYSARYHRLNDRAGGVVTPPAAATALLNRLADLINESRNAEAAELSSRLLVDADTIEDAADRAALYFLAGKAQMQIGHYEDAERLFRQTLDSEATTSEGREFPTILVNLGLIYAKRGQYEEAMSLYSRALQATSGESLDRASILYNMSAALTQVGRNDEAEAALRKAFEIVGDVEAADSPYHVAIALGLASIAYHRGDLEQAEGYLREALASSSLRVDAVGRASALESLGAVYLARGDYVHAEGIFREALDVATKASDRRRVAYLTYRLGAVALERARLEEAIAYLREAANTMAEIGDRRGEAIAKGNLGQGLLLMGDSGREAMALLTEASESLDSLGTPEGEELRNWLAEVAQAAMTSGA